MNLHELETVLLQQSEMLIQYKDSQVKPILLAYKSLLDELLLEVTKMYGETNTQGEWDWKAISKSKRIEALFLQMESSLQSLASTTEKTLEVAMKNIVTIDYVLASYMIVKQIEDWIPVPPVIPKSLLKEILEVPWSGDHFSDRIWLNKELLKVNLKRELTRSVITGESFKKTTKRLTAVLETEAYKAERLVRTEMIAASNRGQKAYYKEFNSKFGKYNMLSGAKVLETLDRKTCSVCRSMDGKEFGPDEIDSISDVEHPRCRRRIVPIIRGFEEEKFTRAARDEKGTYYRTNAKDFEAYAKEQGIPFKYEKEVVKKAKLRTIQSGGRNKLSLDDFFREEEEAQKVYESIRKNKADVKEIAKNTGFKESRIQRIKNHVFFNKHELNIGYSRFDPDIEIANAWMRMYNGDYKELDIMLLRHELFESRFEGIFKTDYNTAHAASNKAGNDWNAMLEKEGD